MHFDNVSELKDLDCEFSYHDELATIGECSRDLFTHPSICLPLSLSASSAN